MTTDHAKEQAQAQLRSILEMVAAHELDWDRFETLKEEREFFKKEELHAELVVWEQENKEEWEELAEIAGDYEDQDAVREAMHNNALSCETRTDWSSNPEDNEPAEFRILICFGGPTVEIQGELGEYGEPSSAWIQYQDWGTPMTRLLISPDDEESLLTYCSVFYFGN